MTVLLLVFLGAIGFALDRAFARSADEAMAERLDLQMLLLLAAVDVAVADERAQVISNEQFTDARFTLPESDLYGVVNGPQGQTLWESPSLIGASFFQAPSLATGERVLTQTKNQSGQPLNLLSLGVEWAGATAEIGPQLTFTVAEQRAPQIAAQNAFRWTILRWFIALGVAVLLVQSLVLRWLTRPLRRMETEIELIEQGDRSALTADELPSELTGVAKNLNQLIDVERRRATRFRETVNNLAHSIKTPLAVIQAGGADNDVSKAVDQIDAIVSEQLKRVALEGVDTVGQTQVPIAEEIEQTVRGLEKIHRDKAIRCQVDVDPELRLRFSRADFIELMGNLLDNAFKYADQQVSVQAKPNNGRLLIDVDDDGPGIPINARSVVLQRGSRLDETRPGQGIGLAWANEIVSAYRGQLTLDEAPSGGLRVRVNVAL